jgi:chromosome segregation ATPase
MRDTIQRDETRLTELEVENKSLEGKLKEQESKINHLQANITETELKLKDSVSKAKDLGAEIEIKTAHGLQLETVSNMLWHICVLFFVTSAYL